MKFTKMSLIAALLVAGSSAFAVENVKVSGDAKLFYATDDATTNGIGNAVGNGSDSLFNKGSSAGQAAFSLGMTADLTKGVSAGTHVTVLTTLGLEGQLVNNVWEGTASVTDSWIVDEAWIAAKLSEKTTAKIGRQTLDTPLVFTEEWSIAKNTFEAAVIINEKDIPDTVLVGAYVGGSNGASAINQNRTGIPGAGIGNRIQLQNLSNTTFSQFYNGAFAAGFINNSHKPLTVQGWYYAAPQYVDAFWLEADLDCAKIPGLIAGVQYTQINYNKSVELPIAKDSSNDAFAVMLGYQLTEKTKDDKKKQIAKIAVAYSQTGTETDSTLNLGAGENLATLGNAPQSKLYTEAWWNYGYISQVDTTAINVTAEYSAKEIADFGLYYTQASRDTNNGTIAKNDMMEATLTATKEVGPLEATAAYIYTKSDDLNAGDAYNAIQVYLTLKY